MKQQLIERRLNLKENECDKLKLENATLAQNNKEIKGQLLTPRTTGRSDNDKDQIVSDLRMKMQ